MFVWNAHEGAVTSLAFGPDGRFLVSGGSDEQVKVWEPFTGVEQFAIPIPHAATPVPLRWLTLSGDGKWAVVHMDSQLLFLDLQREQIAIERTFPQIHILRRTPDGHSVALLVASMYANGQPGFRVCDFGLQFDTYPPVKGYSPRSRVLAFSPDGTRIAIGQHQFRWPAVSGDRGSWIDTKKYEPEDLAFSADNEHLFALVGGKIAVYSLFSCLYKTKLKGHCGQITAMQLSPDGRRLWTASRDATVKCWDTHSLALDRTFRFDTGGLDCLAISPDGNVAAVGSAQKGTITVWDLG